MKVYTVKEASKLLIWEQHHCVDEAKELQELLEENHDLLCGEQIEPEDPRRWLLVKREMPVPDPNTGVDKWAVDFFFVDHKGMPTFVECKRYKDTRSRREVVGQMLEYAANGHHYWDKETLRKYAEETAKQEGRKLGEAVLSLVQDNSATVDDFFAKVIDNLAQGQVRLIFFLEEAPYELRSIVDFLNKQMELAEVLIIEAKQFSDGKSKLVIPLLFGFTEQARRVKKTVTITKGSQRKKWDEVSFFADAETRLGLNSQELAALRKLYEFSDEKSEIDWGTGANRGSFNPKFDHISGKSLYTVYSDGSLTLNFGWLHGENAERYRDMLKDKTAKIPGLTVPTNSEYPSIPINEWNGKVDEIIGVLQKVIEG